MDDPTIQQRWENAHARAEMVVIERFGKDAPIVGGNCALCEYQRVFRELFLNDLLADIFKTRDGD